MQNNKKSDGAARKFHLLSWEESFRQNDNVHGPERELPEWDRRPVYVEPEQEAFDPIASSIRYHLVADIPPETMDLREVTRYKAVRKFCGPKMGIWIILSAIGRSGDWQEATRLATDEILAEESDMWRQVFSWALYLEVYPILHCEDGDFEWVHHAAWRLLERMTDTRNPHLELMRSEFQRKGIKPTEPRTPATLEGAPEYRAIRDTARWCRVRPVIPENLLNLQRAWKARRSGNAATRREENLTPSADEVMAAATEAPESEVAAPTEVTTPASQVAEAPKAAVVEAKAVQTPSLLTPEQKRAEQEKAAAYADKAMKALTIEEFDALSEAEQRKRVLAFRIAMLKAKKS